MSNTWQICAGNGIIHLKKNTKWFARVISTSNICRLFEKSQYNDAKITRCLCVKLFLIYGQTIVCYTSIKHLIPSNITHEYNGKICWKISKFWIWVSTRNRRSDIISKPHDCYKEISFKKVHCILDIWTALHSIHYISMYS